MIKPAVAVSAVMMVALWPAWADDNPEMQATASMAEMMNRIVRPTSDAVFYVASEAPADDAAWSDLENKALMLAESANLLLMPGYVGDSERWSQDVKLMKDAALAHTKPLLMACTVGSGRTAPLTPSRCVSKPRVFM